MRLLACSGHLPRHDDVLAVAKHSPEGIAGQRSGLGFLPGHDHSGVQVRPSGTSRSVLWPLEIPREVSRENLPEFPVIGFRIERFLVFPFLEDGNSCPCRSSEPLRKTHAEAGGSTWMPSKSVRFSRTRRRQTNSPKPSRIHPPQFRTHGKNGFGFRSEIERVL